VLEQRHSWNVGYPGSNPGQNNIFCNKFFTIKLLIGKRGRVEQFKDLINNRLHL
jgi:hypothetical protein